jgi:adenosine deaminase
MNTPNQSPELSFLDGVGLADIHSHVGFSVPPAMLWDMAHDQGIKLPTKDFWKFQDLITIREAKTYEDYIKMYDLIEHIQSSPESLFMAMQHAVAGAYLRTNITTLELRFNPILRSRNGERDLDHLIIFALQGMERAMLKYPVKAGVILMMDRRFNHQENAGVIRKAIKYKDRGVVGIDLAGPIQRTEQSQRFKPADIADLVEEARAAGLGITVHTGEATGLDEMWEVVEKLKPDRIGHGFACVKDEKLMKTLRERNIILELCPTSNLNTSLIKNMAEFGTIIKTLQTHQVPFTINTDGPEMQHISMRSEYALLLQHKILTEKEILACNALSHQVTFINRSQS